MLMLAQAQEILAALGIKLPDLVVQALVDQVNSVYACLQAQGYPDSTITLILTYLLSLLGVVSAYKYVSSERAPSGAARSYKFGTLAEGYAQFVGLIELWDKSGCTADLIPDDPAGGNGGLWVASASRCCR